MGIGLWWNSLRKSPAGLIKIARTMPAERQMAIDKLVELAAQHPQDNVLKHDVLNVLAEFPSMRYMKELMTLSWAQCKWSVDASAQERVRTCINSLRPRSFASIA